MAHVFGDGERTRDVTICESVTFESLLLPQNILNGLKCDGFVKPSPIQLRAIPVGRCGFGKVFTIFSICSIYLILYVCFADIIMRSKSGTGKTLVFTILALETVDVSRNVVQVLILTPTREIAVQIEGVVKKIGDFIPGTLLKFYYLTVLV